MNMQASNLMPYRPVPLSQKRMIPYRPSVVRLGQTTPARAGALTAILSTALLGSAAYLGFRAGIKEKGAVKWVGYVVGVAFGLSTLLTANIVVGQLMGSRVVTEGGVPQDPITNPLNQVF